LHDFKSKADIMRMQQMMQQGGMPQGMPAH